MDAFGAIIAIILTIMVFTYFGSEIPVLRYVFRITQHIFIGAALGYAAVIVFDKVILNSVSQMGGAVSNGVPLLLGLLLLTRSLPGLRILSNLPLAFVVGVGSALALSGALFGTLLSQMGAVSHSGGNLQLADNPADILGTLVMVFGVIVTLGYFFFSYGYNNEGRPNRYLGIINRLGRYTMMVAFGGLLATLTALSVDVLRERIYFLMTLGGLNSNFH